jgi:hypothetical protein
MASATQLPTRSFDPPQEPDWHRAIAEAAYYLAEKRRFSGDNALEDWLAAEQQMRQMISPVLDSEAIYEQLQPIPTRIQ